MTVYLEVLCACTFVHLFMGSWELNPGYIGRHMPTVLLEDKRP